MGACRTFVRGSAGGSSSIGRARNLETGERRVLLGALVSSLAPALDDLLLAARVIRSLLLLGLAPVVVGMGAHLPPDPPADRVRGTLAAATAFAAQAAGAIRNASLYVAEAEARRQAGAAPAEVKHLAGAAPDLLLPQAGAQRRLLGAARGVYRRSLPGPVQPRRLSRLPPHRGGGAAHRGEEGALRTRASVRAAGRRHAGPPQKVREMLDCRSPFARPPAPAAA